MESVPVFAGETPTRAAQLPGSGASAFLMHQQTMAGQPGLVPEGGRAAAASEAQRALCQRPATGCLNRFQAAKPRCPAGG